MENFTLGIQTQGLISLAPKKGKGFNVNIAWNTKGVGDLDYIYAFNTTVLPILREFKPDICFVSAGFDAAEGDPLGECKVTPEGYSWMISNLMKVCPHVLVALEGGYHIESLKLCISAVIETLQGSRKEPSFPSHFSKIKKETIENVSLTREYLSPYWKLKTLFFFPQFQNSMEIEFFLVIRPLSRRNKRNRHCLPRTDGCRRPIVHSRNDLVLRAETHF